MSAVMTNDTVLQQTVSVIVPTFNRANYLGECLDSLLAQTVPPLEILVIDDGSEDATAEVVAHYGSRITYIYKENGGKPSAVNLGLTHARGDLIWIFDDDDVALLDAIANRLDALALKPEAGFVYSPHFLGTNGPDGRILRGQQTYPPQYKDEEFFLEIMRGCFFHLATALVRREHYDTLKGLDPGLFSGEDYDFQIRLARIARPAFCTTPTFIFRQHLGLRGANTVRYSAMQRSMVFKKYSLAIGHKIRKNIAHGEYLVPRLDQALTAQETSQALLNRIHVMANHGCVLALVEDLAAFLVISDEKNQLSDVELDSISMAISRGWAYDACVCDWVPFLAAIRELKSLPNGKSVIFALAKGLLRLAKSYPGNIGERVERTIYATKITLVALFNY